VTAYLETQSAGSYYDNVTEEPACTSGTPTTLIGLDDLKGSFQADNLHGGAGANLITGETGKDSLFGESGNDEISAKDTYNLSPQPEKDVGGGGEGQDRCSVNSGLDELTGCEFVE
jgi:Ca2+-binding RTX toxin-like protein